jgi:hypothetical protein
MSTGPGLESLVDRMQIFDKPFLFLMYLMYILTYRQGV